MLSNLKQLKKKNPYCFDPHVRGKVPLLKHGKKKKKAYNASINFLYHT